MMNKIPMVIALATVIASRAAAQDPICVIDGQRRPIGDCSLVPPRGVDPRKIDRVDVLKGPAAAARYGPDAQNGVVAIYLKEGVPINASPADPDPIGRFLFPPELVIGHQQAIGLTDDQRSAIQQAMKDAQSSFVDLQFRLSTEVEKLQQMLQASAVDETRTLDQLDRVLAREREIKRAQLGLMIRIRNVLTEQQRATLATLR